MKMSLCSAVLMLLSLGAEGEVVLEDFSKCKETFLNGPPVFNTKTPSRHVFICQKHIKVYRFATRYDSEEKIPVYSAYKYQVRGDCYMARPQITWMVEPQLEDKKNGDQMGLQMRMKIEKQASNADYKRSKYDKGHLYPFCHTADDDTASSTFTLTNAAPQKCDFNWNWYDEVESKVKPILDDCSNIGKSAYVVTGVVPSKGNNLLRIGRGVNVPTHFWTAFCCCDNNKKDCTFGGYIMGNNEESSEQFSSPENFNKKVSNLYQTDNFDVFANACSLSGNAPAKRPREE
ncbi:endonuclease domain-containing 1 protein-like [Hoplias malabaricus]|uniref:endonuclease domain-containing 1 protein-like n=1 Tax=Hoplias malabaricus TaxID=27720 RepID=UPI0034617BAE